MIKSLDQNHKIPDDVYIGITLPERKFTMFYVFLAEGFEETEALAPVDVMRRAKLDVKTVGVTGECVTSSHGVPVKAVYHN